MRSPTAQIKQRYGIQRKSVVDLFGAIANPVSLGPCFICIRPHKLNPGEKFFVRSDHLNQTHLTGYIKTDNWPQ
ncbi:hypothetical protein [Laspinema olomoucense]|uniref:Uncharacterized protein n=1 Tax=Laspinema olomoucense D3b TaxID=2953688 RepID=A0ABT2N4V8_9CYAN|nr:hypothetical protein [Laspinema sp. D3b]MCT7977724.1 hypothetical protein [Laspinema sp. D3b]